ncbi:MAG: hypothetical protein HYT70_00270 [Candidatus Aenigmarchaeota archaeon]|nr:hypothetical protein [Candidatus Aenigmarchaeota archaeon]
MSVRPTFVPVMLVAIAVSLFSSAALAQVQSHPLSQLFPIDLNLSLTGVNITNAGYVFFGTIGILVILRLGVLLLASNSLRTLSLTSPSFSRIKSIFPTSIFISSISLCKVLNSLRVLTGISVRTFIRLICHFKLLNVIPRWEGYLVLNPRFLFFLILSPSVIAITLFSSSALAQVQSHPVSQLFPADTNLNLTGVNITNVSYVFFGNNSVDTYLYRSGTNTLQTASHLVVTGGWVNSTNVNASAAAYAQTLYEAGQSLADRYLGISSQAANSQLLDNFDSAFFNPLNMTAYLIGINTTWLNATYINGTQINSTSVNASGTITANELVTRTLNLGWQNLTDYPTGCSAGQAVITIGDTLTCGEAGGGTNVSLLYGNNGTNWLPVNVTNGGILRLNVQQATSVEADKLDNFDSAFFNPLNMTAYLIGINTTWLNATYINGTQINSTSINVSGTLYANRTAFNGVTYTWPSADGNADQLLTTNAAGTLSWTTVSSTNNMTGYGTAGYVPLWFNTTSLNNSVIYQLGGNIGIGTATPGAALVVSGNVNVTNNISASIFSGLTGSTTRIRATGSTTGNGSNSSIYFLDSTGATKARLETGVTSTPGTGFDGDLIVTPSIISNIPNMTINNISAKISTTANSGQLLINLASTGGFYAGDEVLIIQMNGTGTGTFETRFISSVINSTYINLTANLANTYVENATSDAQVVRIPHYQNVFVKSGMTLTAPAWNNVSGTGGVLIFRAQNSVVIEANGTINMTGKGFNSSTPAGGIAGPASVKQGRNGTNGDGPGGGRGGTNGGIAGNSGGTSGGTGAGCCSGAGGGGSYAGGATNGTNGGNASGGAGGGGGAGGVNSSGPGSVNGSINGVADLSSSIFMGSGGGSGAGGNVGGNGSVAGGGGGAGGNGGAGGGIIIINAYTIINNGTIASNGASGARGVNGSNGVGGSSGGDGGGGGGSHGAPGGGGAGGSIWLNARTVILGNVTASGGIGGSSNESKSGNGGSGAGGLDDGESCTLQDGHGGGGAGGNINGTGGSRGFNSLCGSASNGKNGTATVNGNATGGTGGSGRIKCDGTCTGATAPASGSNGTYSAGGNPIGYGTLFIGSVVTDSADVAEYYRIIDQSIEPGDVAALGSQPRYPDQPGGPKIYGLKKTSQEYDQHAIGVVSTKPGIVLGSDDSQDQRLLALAGRTPVKASAENGPIEIGDALAPSSKPGTAMKATQAGQIIGYALEPLEQGEGKILAFVNVGYYVPAEEYKRIKSVLENLVERVGILERLVGANGK